MQQALTGDVGDGLELVVPLVADLDGLFGLGGGLGGTPLLVGVLGQGLHVLRHEGVEDVPKVLPVREAPLWKLAGEEAHELLVASHIGPELEHRKLIVVRHVDPVHLVEGHQGLLLGQHLLEEVLVPVGKTCQG